MDFYFFCSPKMLIHAIVCSQSEDYALLRSDSRMKTSQVSLVSLPHPPTSSILTPNNGLYAHYVLCPLQERPIYKGSQSTLGGRWAPQGSLEAEGLPTVWHNEGDNNARVAMTELAKDDPRRRANSYQKSSNMSLVLVSIYRKKHSHFNSRFFFVFFHWI